MGCGSERVTKVSTNKVDPSQGHIHKHHTESTSASYNKWVHQPFEGIANCIDTLALDDKDSGYYYACEHEWKLALKYVKTGETYKVEVYGPTHDHREKPKIEIVTKYELIQKDNALHMSVIENLSEDGFKPVDQAHITQVYKSVNLSTGK